MNTYKVHAIEVDYSEHVQSTDMDDIYAFHAHTPMEKEPTSQKHYHQRIRFTIETWSGFNIINPVTYKQLVKPQLRHISLKIYAYGNLCQFTTTVESAKQVVATQLIVADPTSGNLLSYETARELGLLHINADVNAMSTHIGST